MLRSFFDMENFLIQLKNIGSAVIIKNLKMRE